MKEIIERLEAKRKELDLSYEKLGELADTSRGNAYKILTGKAKPMGETLLALAGALEFESLKKTEKGWVLIDKFVGCTHKDIDDKVKGIVIPQKNRDLVVHKIEKGKFTGESKRIKKKTETPSKIAEVVANIKEENDCPNCTYSETKSGLKIRILKCPEHKKKINIKK